MANQDSENRSKYIELIKEKYGVDKVWSYSRVNSFDQDPYEWFLKYILELPSDKSTGNAYGIYGNMVHDIMEDYYNGKIKREDCKKTFNEEWDRLSLLGLKFNNTDEESERKLKKKYKDDLDNFFDTFESFTGKCTCEMPVAVLLKNKKQKEAFFGYIDFLDQYTEDGRKKYHIIDYKTSTMYKGKAIEDHARQLLLYAIGLRQKTKCKYEDIDVGWNFLKYVTVIEEQKNGKTKERYIERYELVTKLETSIKKWLRELGFSDTVYEQCIATGTLDPLPQEVKDKFIIKDCIIMVPFTKESAQKLQRDLCNKCKTLNELTNEYEETKNEELFMWEPTQQDEFWLYNLCSYSSNLHKPFANYLHKKELMEQHRDDTSWLDDTVQTREEDLFGNFFNSIQTN